MDLQIINLIWYIKGKTNVNIYTFTKIFKNLSERWKYSPGKNISMLNKLITFRSFLCFGACFWKNKKETIRKMPI